MTADSAMGGEFTRMLDMTVQALRAINAPPGDEAESSAIGESADGRVRAEMGSDGRLRSLQIEPRLMRLGSEELAAHVVTAVNAAIDGLRSGSAPQVGDLSQLREQLQQVRDSAVPRLQSFLQTLTDVQDQLARRGRVG